MTKTRSTLLSATLALLVAASPAVACLTTAHEASVAERGHTGCDSSPDAPTAALCAYSGTVIPANPPAASVTATAGSVVESRLIATLDLDAGLAGPVRRSLAPRARSAPTHLLHATFLI